MSRGLRLGWSLLGISMLVGGLLVAVPGRGEAAALLKGVVQADGGGDHTCAVRTDGTVWCWGDNDFGQLGDGTSVARLMPVKVVNLTQVVQVSAGVEHTCATRSNHTVWCWGRNDFGQVGDGATSTRLTPVRVIGLTGVEKVSAGDYFTCAVRSVGTVWCWGDNWAGALGNGTVSPISQPTPVQAIGLSQARQVSAGGSATCARRSDGSVRCWGWNSSYGQVGVPSWSDQTTPVAVQGLPGPVTQVQAGGYHACARRSDGSVWCWGTNRAGALGTGTVGPTRVTTPTKSLMTNAAGVSVGDDFTCARTSGKRVKCWGINTSGQLGNGALVSRSAPVAVVGLASVAGISSGNAHTCAVLTDHTMRCWGDNSFGQLGNGTTQNSTFPAPVLT
jgi:alpha-tubulin suppressor-like RCC1 family protein